MNREDPQLKIRLAPELMEWLTGQRRKNRSTNSSEVSRAVRERKERTEQEKAA